jgi:hypothetical protein
MSTNRSVQAAQRRRAGPPEPQQQYSRGPSTSINSAQLFANQARPGNGPNIPNGRLAGQQAAYSQQQMMQQQHQQMHDNQEKEGVQGISKMTIAQAVTLITLRLGAVESKLIEMEHSVLTNGNNNFNSDGNTVQIDKNVLNTIMNRLEALEKRNPSGTNNSSPDITLLKQQIDTIKPVIVQTKNATVSLLKDNKDLKVLSDNLKQEVQTLRETVTNLETITSIHTEQIKDLVVSFSSGTEDIELNFGKSNNEIEIDENGLISSSNYNANEFDLQLNPNDLKNINFADSDLDDTNVTLEGLSVPEYNPHDLTGIDFEEEITSST